MGTVSREHVQAHLVNADKLQTQSSITLSDQCFCVHFDVRCSSAPGSAGKPKFVITGNDCSVTFDDAAAALSNQAFRTSLADASAQYISVARALCSKQRKWKAGDTWYALALAFDAAGVKVCFFHAPSGAFEELHTWTLDVPAFLARLTHRDTLRAHASLRLVDGGFWAHLNIHFVHNKLVPGGVECVVTDTRCGLPSSMSPSTSTS